MSTPRYAPLEFLVPCGQCEGEGEYDVAHVSGDPQRDRTVKCDECRGTGVVYSDNATFEEMQAGLRIAMRRGDPKATPVLRALEQMLERLKAKERIA